MMGKTKGLYNPEYLKGEKVKIVPREVLIEFLNTWKFHNKITLEQITFAGLISEIESVGFYHGGDELYRLKDVPGIWHEICLERVTSK